MSAVYFDTSVFLAILKPETTAKQIRTLIKELDEENVRIYTSILTIQEASVLGFRRGTVAKDHITRIGKLARIVGISPDIALTAAKLEAHISDRASEPEKDRADKKRRKWDCFHIATAQVYKCSIMFAEDKPMQKRQSQLGLTNLKILPPRAKTNTLEFDAPVAAAARTATPKPNAKKRNKQRGLPEEGNQLEANPAHPAPVQGSDEGRAESKAAEQDPTTPEKG